MRAQPARSSWDAADRPAPPRGAPTLITLFADLARWAQARLVDFFSFETAFCFFLFFAFIGESPFWTFIPGNKLFLALGVGIMSAFVIGLRGRIRGDRDAWTLMFLMIAFMTWTLLSTIWTPSVNYANVALMRLIGLSGWCIASTALIISGDPERQRRFFAGMALIGLYLGWESLQFYRNLVATGGGGFLTPLEMDYLSLARAVGSGALVTLYYALYESRWPGVWRLASALVSVGLHIMVLMIGARTSLVATVLCGVILWLPRLRFGRTPRALLLQLLAASAVILIFVFGVGRLPGGRQIEDALVGVNRILYLMDKGFESNDRYYRYVTTWREVERSPFLGSGVGSWAMLNGYGDTRDYPHNIWLDVWFELGIPGLLIILALFWWALRRFWPIGEWVRQRYALLALALFGTTFLSSQFSGNYNEQWLMCAYLGLLLLVPLRLRRPDAPPAPGLGNTLAP